jgi:hypothetical protein
VAESVQVSTRSGSVSRLKTKDALLLVAVVAGAVLRLWDLGASQPSIDESYSALAARLSVPDLIAHIDQTDPHPPLFYLLLKPFALFTTDVGFLRLASAIAAVAAVGVMALWQRRAGLAGVLSTLIFALAPFQLMYARQIRMYGIICLAGVVAAWCAERWLESRRASWAAGAAAAGLLAALSHAVGPLVLLGLAVLPLARRDRPAWQLRAFVAAAAGLFAVVWGSHLVEWSGRSGSLPSATPSWLTIVLNETVAPVPDQRWLVLPLVGSGAVILLRDRGARAHVWICMFAVPLLVLYLASISRGILVPKSLVPFAWGTTLALGVLCAAAVRKSRYLGAVTMSLVGLTIVPYMSAALHPDEGSGAVMERLLSEVPSDAGIAVRADEWQAESLVRWYGSVSVDHDARPVVERVGSVIAFWPSGSTRSSEAWFVSMNADGPPAELSACGPRMVLGGRISAQCVEFLADPSGTGS